MFFYADFQMDSRLRKPSHFVYYDKLMDHVFQTLQLKAFFVTKSPSDPSAKNKTCHVYLSLMH